MPINIEREKISQCVLKREKSFRDFPAEICLSPREVEILELKAMGLGNKQIAWKLGLSPDTIKNFVTSALQKSGRNTAGTVYALVESGKISKEKLSKDLDFTRFKYLTDKQKLLLTHVSLPQTVDDTCGQMAHDLRISEQTFKNHCGEIYKTLEIAPSLLSLRVYMLLKLGQ